jgi:hypothetical protein
MEGWVGPRVCLDAVEKRKILLWPGMVTKKVKIKITRIVNILVDLYGVQSLLSQPMSRT